MTGQASAGPIGRGSVARVGIATALTAFCGYAVVYLAARDLAPAGFSVFGVYWGTFGLVTSATNGLMQETTRETRGEPDLKLALGGHVRPVHVAGIVGVVAAIVIAVSSPLWSTHVFAEDRWLSVGLLSVGLAGFCVHSALMGTLASANYWSQYGTLMVSDALIRVIVAAVAVVIGWGLAGFLWATAAGAVAWTLMLMFSPITRARARLSTPGDLATFLRGTAHSVTAALASGVLVMGFPVLLKLTSNQFGAQGGVIILLVTMTRAPLLVPMGGMQSNLIAHFVDKRAERLRALLAPAAVLGVIGAVGVPTAALLGPWLLHVGFGPGYNASGQLLGWLTLAAVVLAMLALTGNAVVAAALHRAYSLGWVGATVASTLLLLLPVTLEARTVIALACGPLVGIAIHLGALARPPADLVRTD
jgi:O-antigen/teichoic acid export membrane protein